MPKHFTLFLFAAITASSIPALAAGSDLSQDRFEEVLQIATDHDNAGIALAHSTMLYELSSRVPVSWAMEKLKAKKSKHPQVQVVLERRINRLSRELGQGHRALEGTPGKVSQHGCLTDFALVGPFANESMENQDKRLGPELGEAGPYQGKIKQVAWRKAPDFSDLCDLNLSAMVRPRSESVVYLASVITSPKAQKAVLLLGSVSPYQIWINGKKVAKQKEKHGFAFDAEGWSVNLSRGKNDILIKMSTPQQDRIDLLARLVDAKSGAPMTNLEVEPVWRGKRVSDKEALQPDTKFAMAHRAKSLMASGDSSKALWGAWLMSYAQYRNTATPWRDVAQRLEKEIQQGRFEPNPREYVALASLFTEHWRKLAILEQARLKHPNSTQVLLQLASEYQRSLSMPTRWKAKEIYASLMEQATGDKTFAQARMSLATWWQDQGNSPRALELARKVSPQMLQASAVMRDYVSLLSQNQRDQEILELRKNYGDMLQRTLWVVRRRYLEAVKALDFDQALKLTRAQRVHYPASTYWLEEEANVLHAKGDTQAAIALLDAQLETQPGKSEFYLQRAKLQQAQGDEAGALQTLEALLVYTPQDQELRDKIAMLQPEQDRFYQVWMKDDLKGISDAMPAGPYPSSTLVDQTVIKVAPNGLTQQVTQEVYRVNTSSGINDASVIRAYYQTGDERIDILSVRVIKADGTTSQDYDVWRSENSRKASTTYNDSGTMTIRANNVNVGDIVEFQIQKSEVANQNFRGDYFGDLTYVQGTKPIGFLRYAVLYPKAWSTLYFRAPKLKHQRTDNKLPDGSAPQKGYISTSFELTQTPKVKTESNQPGSSEVYDYILVSNKRTPTEIGTWWWNLIKEQLVVDEPMRQTVAKLTKGLKTEVEKVQAIHNYVVKNTRYLHVGLGIHGWKPYRTTTCFRNRYGDCKDKAALLKVMLEEAGVPANLVLVRTRSMGGLEPKPAAMMVFNHAIAYVPSMDLFLDGTAEFNGTNELVTMDQGAYGLIVEDGGKARLVTLPVDKSSDNVESTTMTVDLREGTPKATVELVVKGVDASYFRAKLEDPKRRDEAIQNYLANTYEGAKLLSATTSDLTKLEQPVTIKATFESPQFARKVGQKMLLTPMGQKKDLLRSYATEPDRDQPLIIRVPFTTKTKIRYLLPKSAKPVSALQGAQLTSPFGQANVEYTTSKNGELSVQVTYSIDVARVSEKDYPKFRAFMGEVTAAINETIEVK